MDFSLSIVKAGHADTLKRIVPAVGFFDSLP